MRDPGLSPAAGVEGRGARVAVGGRLAKLMATGEAGVAFAFVLMMAVFSVVTPQFLTLSNFESVLRRLGPMFFIAAAQTIAVLSAGIDLSVGSIVSLVSVVSFGITQARGLLSGLATGLGIGIAVGVANGLAIAYLRVQPFVATLGMMFVTSGLALMYTGGGPLWGLEGPAHAQLYWLGGGWLGPLPSAVFLSLCCVVALHIMLRYTRFGRHVFTVGASESVARIAGINVESTKVFIYTLSGLLTAMGAIILTSRVMSGQPTLGAGTIMLESVGAVVIGGTSLFGGRGSVARTVIGVLVLGFMLNGLNLIGVESFPQLVIIGVLIVASVAVSILRERRDQR